MHSTRGIQHGPGTRRRAAAGGPEAELRYRVGRDRPARVGIWLTAVLVGITVLLTACGGSDRESDQSTLATPGGGSGATSGSSSADGQQPSGPAYAQCMRQHGVTDFPDPQGPNQNQFLIPASVQDDPHYAEASKTCEPLRPQQAAGGADTGGISQQKLLAFAQCMRANGVPKFPDPTQNGGINIGGVDTNSPQFRHAVQVCADQTGLQIGSGQ